MSFKEQLENRRNQVREQMELGVQRRREFQAVVMKVITEVRECGYKAVDIESQRYSISSGYTSCIIWATHNGIYVDNLMGRGAKVVTTEDALIKLILDALV